MVPPAPESGNPRQTLKHEPFEGWKVTKLLTGKEQEACRGCTETPLGFRTLLARASPAAVACPADGLPMGERWGPEVAGERETFSRRHQPPSWDPAPEGAIATAGGAMPKHDPFGDLAPSDPVQRIRNGATRIRSLRSQVGHDGLTPSATRTLIDELTSVLEEMASALEEVAGARGKLEGRGGEGG